jgi:hypothetical protein
VIEALAHKAVIERRDSPAAAFIEREALCLALRLAYAPFPAAP